MLKFIYYHYVMIMFYQTTFC